MHIAHKFESGWDVGVIKAFDKRGPPAGKFSVKYKDDPKTGGRTLFCVRVMEKTSTGLCCGSRALIPLEVTMTVVKSVRNRLREREREREREVY